MRKIIFPLKVKGKTFNTHRELYDYYYSVNADYLTEFSKPFWDDGINLVELVHFPEKFTIHELFKPSNK